MTLPEMEFEQPQGEYEEVYEEPQAGPEEPLPEPEPEPEPSDPAEDRFSRLESAVSELVEWARTSGERPQAQESAPPPRPRPNFGENTVAQALWDRIEESDRKNEERWGRIERLREENARVEAGLAQLTDQTEQYIGQRVGEGDPKVDTKSVMNVVAQMGLLRDRRIPVTRALQLAYNAIAFDSAKQQSRQRGQQEVRKPEARIPAPFNRTQPTARRPAAATPAPAPPAGNSLAARTKRLEQESNRLHQQLGKMSPDELQDQLGMG